MREKEIDRANIKRRIDDFVEVKWTFLCFLKLVNLVVCLKVYFWDQFMKFSNELMT